HQVQAPPDLWQLAYRGLLDREQRHVLGRLRGTHTCDGWCPSLGEIGIVASGFHGEPSVGVVGPPGTVCDPLRGSTPPLSKRCVREDRRLSGVQSSAAFLVKHAQTLSSCATANRVRRHNEGRVWEAIYLTVARLTVSCFTGYDPPSRLPVAGISKPQAAVDRPLSVPRPRCMSHTK